MYVFRTQFLNVSARTKTPQLGMTEFQGKVANISPFRHETRKGHVLIY